MNTLRLVPRNNAERVIWGTAETGLVPDIIYHSDNEIHVIEFSLARGGSFVHSEEKRTLFGADEVFHILEGTLVLANPQTGEVYPIQAGHSAFFRRDTWHHGFANMGNVRVLEFMSPPPALGTTQPYARKRPYLDEWRYTEPAWDEGWPMNRRQRTPTISVLQPADRLWSLGDPRGILLLGLIAQTEHLTVFTASLEGDMWTKPTTHRGKAVAVVTDGVLSVRSHGRVRTVESGDAVVISSESEHQYRATGAQFLVGIGHPASPVE